MVSLPREGELVVCEVADIEEETGAYMDLVEYDTQGFVHVSDVASGWVKRVRDHVDIGERVVCEVIDVDEESKQINLSLKDVSETEEKERIEIWRNETKAKNWISLAVPEDEEEKIESIQEMLIDEYGSLYDALEKGAIDGSSVFKKAGIEDSLAEQLAEIAQENVEVPSIEIVGFVELRSFSPTGVDDIKEALKEAEKEDVSIEYVSAPEYRIKSSSPDYKEAEKEVEKASRKAIDTIEKLGGQGEYYKESRSEEG